MFSIIQQLQGAPKHIAPVVKRNKKESGSVGRPSQFADRIKEICRLLDKYETLSTDLFVKTYEIKKDTMYRQLRRIQTAGYISSEKISFKERNVQMRIWTLTEQGRKFAKT